MQTGFVYLCWMVAGLRDRGTIERVLCCADYSLYSKTLLCLLFQINQCFTGVAPVSDVL